MTPPATVARPTTPHRARPAQRPLRPVPPPRRVSGPAGGARVAREAALPLGVRAGAAARRVPDAAWLDRLVRGRVWIGFVTVALMGIVFMQVSLLGLNAGISRSVAAADALERQNSVLRADVARLGASTRIEETAARLGMVQPGAGDVAFVEAHARTARRALRVMTAPKPVASAVATAPAAPTTAAATATATATAPATATATAPTPTTPTATAATTAATAPAAMPGGAAIGAASNWTEAP